jgi:hypothetical protein
MYTVLFALALSLSCAWAAEYPTLYHEHVDGSTVELTLAEGPIADRPTAPHFACEIQTAFLEVDHEKEDSAKLSSEELWLMIIADLLICGCCCGLLQLMLYCVRTKQSKKMKLRWVRLKKNYEEIERLDMVRSLDN